MEYERFPRGQSRPIPRDGGAQRPPNFLTPYMRAHSMRNNNQISPGDQTRCEEFLQGRPRVLTRDLFAIANLLVPFRGSAHPSV